MTRPPPHVREPHPTEVDGYRRAVDLGLTPQVPATAPQPVTVSSRRVLLGVVASFAAVLAVVMVLAGGLDPPGWVLGLVTAAGLLLVGGQVLWLRRVTWREVRAGYCRLETMVALYSRDPDHRFGEATGTRGAPWDLRGLWRLDDAGAVVREPDRSVLPPGHYPSPNRPGALELWTGEAWAYRYRDLPAPR